MEKVAGMDVVVAVMCILYLIAKIIVLKSVLGGLLGYMVEKECPIPTEEEMAKWSRWYIKKYFGLCSEKLPTDKSA